MTNSTNIIDGKAVAARALDKIAERVRSQQLRPGLGVILVGDDPASKVYVGRKLATCAQLGFVSLETRLAADCSQQQLQQAIETYNQDPSVHGILLQLPIPKHLDKLAAVESISPAKDVDGLTSASFGKLFLSIPAYVPCTPLGCMVLLQSTGIELQGKSALVIGRSDIVGKPIAKLLLDADCTPTIAHSRSANLPELCRAADIVVAAIGRSRAIKGEWLKQGAIVIDVGINRGDDNKLSGDVDFPSAQARAAAITPVPGGVGPMTIAMLMYNTLCAADPTLTPGSHSAHQFFSLGAPTCSRHGGELCSPPKKHTLNRNQ